MTLPESAWNPPEGAIKDPEMQALYAEIAVRIRQDFAAIGETDTLTEMQLERTAFQYVLLKDTERRSDEALDPKTHRENTTLWFNMANACRRMRQDGLTEDEIKRRITEGVFGALKDVLADVSPDVGADIKRRMAAALESVSF